MAGGVTRAHVDFLALGGVAWQRSIWQLILQCISLQVRRPLQAETQRFNATYARKDERTPLVDFLVLAAAKAKAIYSQAYAELARQVNCNMVCRDTMWLALR
jgi:hypothetical protein